MEPATKMRRFGWEILPEDTITNNSNKRMRKSSDLRTPGKDLTNLKSKYKPSKKVSKANTDNCKTEAKKLPPVRNGGDDTSTSTGPENRSPHRSYDWYDTRIEFAPVTKRFNSRALRCRNVYELPLEIFNCKPALEASTSKNPLENERFDERSDVQSNEQTTV